MINLGGIHSAMEATVNLDQKAAELRITPGNTYALDFFFAERHATQSNFRIDAGSRGAHAWFGWTFNGARVSFRISRDRTAALRSLGRSADASLFSQHASSTAGSDSGRTRRQLGPHSRLSRRSGGRDALPYGIRAPRP